MKKTIIGIVGKHIKDNKFRTDTLIRDEVKQAIFDNGAIAIGILSPNEEILYTGDNWNLTEDKMPSLEFLYKYLVLNLERKTSTM